METTVGGLAPRTVRQWGRQTTWQPYQRAARSEDPLPDFQRAEELIARSLAIGSPADGFYALQVARQTGGAIGWCTEGEIVEALLGVFGGYDETPQL
jgi:threonine synthase